MAGLLGHLSSEDRELIERGVHPVIDETYHIRKEVLEKTEKKKEEKPKK